MEITLPIHDSLPSHYEPVSANHLVFCQHGLDGNTENWEVFIEKLKLKHGEDVYVHLGIANEHPGLTREGIDTCGERLVGELMKVHEVLFQSRRIKLTLVGHSLGGLLLRYAIGLLHERGKLDTMFDLQAYYSFATPHIGGVRKKESGFFNAVANFVMSKILDRVGQQLLVADKDPNLGNIPILVAMSNRSTSPGISSQSKSSFYQALAKFPRRVLYSNIVHDLSVPYCTSAIYHINPYTINEAEIKTSKAYPHVVEVEKRSPAAQEHKDHHVKNSDPNLEIDISTATGEHGANLRQMLVDLQTLEWERVACYFTEVPGMAHFLILNQPPMLPGEDVVQHFVDNFRL